MTKLSVNINKIAVLRNSRGGNNPDLIAMAKDCERFGAEGITVHPRPDERHIRYADVYALKDSISTELNIEGNCQEDKFVNLVLDIVPHQVTLVPDAPGAITSNAGWDTVKNAEFLRKMVDKFKSKGIRVSIFIDPVPGMIEAAPATGTDRIELYTEAYAKGYVSNKEAALASYSDAAIMAKDMGIGINAGHDLSLDNLAFFSRGIPYLDEVSIGHALICDALYLGLENTIQQYKRQLKH